MQISELVSYSVPIEFPLISARAIIIISTYVERKVSAPIAYGLLIIVVKVFLRIMIACILVSP